MKNDSGVQIVAFQGAQSANSEGILVGILRVCEAVSPLEIGDLATAMRFSSPCERQITRMKLKGASDSLVRT
jgi:hypothetical protein